MPRMPDDMAARYGEIFDEFEASIEVLNRSKADTIADLRADLKELGMTGAEISAEVAMLKGAVKLQRMTEAEREKAEAKDDGVADYVTVLALARARARTRGAAHDADGVIIESQPADGGSHEYEGDVAKIPNSSTEAATPHGLSAAVIDDEDMAAGAGSSAGGGSEVSASDVEAVAPHSETPVSHAPVQPGREEPGTTDGAASAGGTANDSPPGAAPASGEAGEANQARNLIPPASPANQSDRTKPNPWCADPDDCGVEASWNHMCGSCLRRRDAQRSAVEAMH